MQEYAFAGKVYGFAQILSNDLLAQIASGVTTPEAAGGQYLREAGETPIADWQRLDTLVWQGKESPTSLFSKLILIPAWAFASIAKMIDDGKSGQGNENDFLYILQTAVAPALPTEYQEMFNDYLEQCSFGIRIAIL